MPKVSMIVPIYNTSKFLSQCLNSILNQTLRDIEVICVNDGSTDNSLSIIENYAKNDSRVKIISKPNAGYGHSMNRGIESARGEYIGIVDSDDYILPEMCERLYDYASNLDLDIIRGGYYKFYEINGEEKKTYWGCMGAKYRNVVYCPRKTTDFYFSSVVTPSGIYKRDFLNKHNIRYNESPGAAFQDHGFWFKTHVLADRAMFIEDAFYMYRFDNPNSSIYSSRSLELLSKEYDYIKEFVDKNEDLFYITNPFYWKARFLNCKLTCSRLAKKIPVESLEMFSKPFERASNSGELDVSLFSSDMLKDLDNLMYHKKTFAKSIKVSTTHSLYREHVTRDLNGIEPSRFHQFVWFAKQFGVLFSLLISIKKMWWIFVQQVKSLYKSLYQKKNFLHEKLSPEYAKKVKILNRMDSYLQKQSDKEYREEMKFWWSLNTDGESLTDTKKRFFRNMPPAEGKLRERQLEYVSVLEALKDVLDENGIMFWPMGGTMIGMLRHSAFVPWDDDIDISMMYEDKEKLFDIINHSGTLKIEEVYWCGNTVLRCPRVKFKDPNRTGLVDIFLWERANNEVTGFKPLWSKRNQCSKRMNDEYQAVKPSLNRLYNGEPIYDAHDKAILEDIFDRNRKKCLHACGTGGTTIYGSIDMWFQAGKWNSVYAEEDILPFREVEFEGTKYKVPFAAEKFLSDQYGDWLQIPSKVKPSHGG